MNKSTGMKLSQREAAAFEHHQVWFSGQSLLQTDCAQSWNLWVEVFCAQASPLLGRPPLPLLISLAGVAARRLHMPVWSAVPVGIPALVALSRAWVASLRRRRTRINTSSTVQRAGHQSRQ